VRCCSQELRTCIELTRAALQAARLVLMASGNDRNEANAQAVLSVLALKNTIVTFPGFAVVQVFSAKDPLLALAKVAHTPRTLGALEIRHFLTGAC
jgi:hypothetical protein